MTSLAWERRRGSATRFWKAYRSHRAGLYGLAGLALIALLALTAPWTVGADVQSVIRMTTVESQPP